MQQETLLNVVLAIVLVVLAIKQRHVLAIQAHGRLLFLMRIPVKDSQPSNFWLHDAEVWIEIKNRGTAPPTLDESLRARALARQTNRPCFVFFGDPLGRRNYRRGCAFRYDPDGTLSVGWRFAECTVCRRPPTRSRCPHSWEPFAD